MKKYNFATIKEGKKDLWIDWCAFLMEHKDEAASTLSEENLIREQCLIVDIEGREYVQYLHETIRDTNKLPANLEKTINRLHLAIFAECLHPLKNTGFTPREGLMLYDIIVE